MRTLKSVSMAVGCSESMISKIENSKALPSLEMLYRIAQELNVEVAEIFSESTDEAIVIRDPVSRLKLRLGSENTSCNPVVLERAIPYKEGFLLDANIHIIPPGAGSEGTYRHVAEEVGYIISGTIVLTVDGNVYELSAGHSFYFDSRLPHSYVNNGSQQCKIFWVNGFRVG